MGALAAAWVPAGAWAQASNAGRVHRIGVLCDADDTPFFFRQLQEVGYEEGRNIEYVFKGVDASPDFDGFATRLVGRHVDLIVACSNDAALAARRATSAVPIVLLYGVVPVEVGLVASLARPGGNVTGSAAITLETAAKSVELFKSAVPGLRKVAVLVDLQDPAGRVLQEERKRSGAALGLAMETLPVHDAADLERAFAALTRARPDGLMVDITIWPRFDAVVAYAAAQRLPAMYPTAPSVRYGGLMAYSPNWTPQSKQNALIVDRILKGAHPRDIPVEQPFRPAFSINLRTARAIGLEIPAAVRLRATSIVDE